MLLHKFLVINIGTEISLPVRLHFCLSVMTATGGKYIINTPMVHKNTITITLRKSHNKIQIKNLNVIELTLVSMKNERNKIKETDSD